MNRVSYIAIVVCAIIIVLCITALVTVTLATPEPEPVTEEYKERASHMAVTNAITGKIYEHTTALFNEIIETAEYQSSLSNSDPRIDESLMELYVTQPSSTAIYRTDANGFIIASVPDSTINYVGDKLHQLSKEIFESEEKLSFQLYFVDSINRTELVMLAPVISNGEYNGCIIFLIDPEVLLSPLFSSYRDAGYDVWMLDEDGNYIYNYDKLLIGTSGVEYATREDSGLKDVMPNLVTTNAGEAIYSTYSYGKLKNIIEACIWTMMFTDYKDMKIVVTSELSGEWRVPKPSVSTDDTLEEYVHAAYSFTNQYGADTAIKTFQNPEKFVTMEYYISAIGVNGTILADPFRPGDTGLDRSLETDSNGVPFIQTMMTRAQQGGGYVIGVSQNPSKNLTEELKLSYVLPIDDEWFITAGTYLPYRPSKVNLSLKNDMISYSRSIQQYNQLYGKEATLSAMNADNGQFSRNDIRVWGVDYEGNILAEINDPGLTTESNLMGMTDVYGASIGRTTVTLANDGGGFQYVYLPDQLTGESSMVLQQVLPIDDEWFVVAGIPLIREYQL